MDTLLLEQVKSDDVQVEIRNVGYVVEDEWLTVGSTRSVKELLDDPLSSALHLNVCVSDQKVIVGIRWLERPRHKELLVIGDVCRGTSVYDGRVSQRMRLGQSEISCVILDRRDGHEVGVGRDVFGIACLWRLSCLRPLCLGLDLVDQAFPLCVVQVGLGCVDFLLTHVPFGSRPLLASHSRPCHVAIDRLPRVATSAGTVMFVRRVGVGRTLDCRKCAARSLLYGQGSIFRNERLPDLLLADFGIAHIETSNMTQVGTILAPSPLWQSRT